MVRHRSSPADPELLADAPGVIARLLCEIKRVRLLGKGQVGFAFHGRNIFFKVRPYAAIISRRRLPLNSVPTGIAHCRPLSSFGTNRGLAWLKKGRRCLWAWLSTFALESCKMGQTLVKGWCWRYMRMHVKWRYILRRLSGLNGKSLSRRGKVSVLITAISSNDFNFESSHHIRYCNGEVPLAHVGGWFRPAF